MAQTLGDYAKTYESQATKNIADLKEVDVTAEIQDRTGVDSSGKEFKYKVIVVEGIEYRVPRSVLGSLKAILAKKPGMKKFSVARQGTKKDDTRYTVVPMD